MRPLIITLSLLTSIASAQVRDTNNHRTLTAYPNPLYGRSGPNVDLTVEQYAVEGYYPAQEAVIPAGEYVISSTWEIIDSVAVEHAVTALIPALPPPIPETFEKGVHIPATGLLVVDDLNNKGWAISVNEEGELLVVGPVHDSPWKSRDEIDAMLVAKRSQIETEKATKALAKAEDIAEAQRVKGNNSGKSKKGTLEDLQADVARLSELVEKLIRAQK